MNDVTAKLRLINGRLHVLGAEGEDTQRWDGVSDDEHGNQLLGALQQREALWREYHAWLAEANKGPAQIAYLHRWRCSDEDYKRGVDYRKRLGIGEKK